MPRDVIKRTRRLKRKLKLLIDVRHGIGRDQFKSKEYWDNVRYYERLHQFLGDWLNDSDKITELLDENPALDRW